MLLLLLSLFSINSYFVYQSWHQGYYSSHPMLFSHFTVQNWLRSGPKLTLAPPLAKLCNAKSGGLLIIN